MKIIKNKAVCTALHNFPVLQAAAVVENDIITRIECPMREKGIRCMRVDVDKLNCCLFPNIDIDDSARF